VVLFINQQQKQLPLLVLLSIYALLASFSKIKLGLMSTRHDKSTLLGTCSINFYGIKTKY